MKFSIMKFIFSFFKGFKENVIEIAGSTTVSADNGVGKSTLATAFFWLLCDRDYDLNGNPKVRHEVDGVPIDDVDVSAELVVDIDGTEHSIKKIQKCRKSKPDANGIVKTTTTNSYEVNAVPLNERDFTAKMLELGIDLSKVLECCHPDVFMSGKVADRRNKLFAMAGSHSDLELAQQDADTALLAEQLQKYKLNEIEAMNKATKKKCNEELDTIPAKIEGMEASKIDIDVAEQELYKNELLRQLKDIEDKEADNSKVYKEYQDIETEIFKLNGFERNDIIRRANEGLDKQKTALYSEIAQIKSDQAQNDAAVKRYKQDIEIKEADLQVYINAHSKAVEQYKAEKAKTFDESAWIFDINSLACPMCKQPLPADTQAKRREDFDKNKEKAYETFIENQSKMLERLTADGKAQQQRKHDCEQAIEDAKKLLDEAVAKGNEIANRLSDKEAELSSLPESVDLTNNAELKALEAQIKGLQDKLDKMPNGEELAAQLKAQRMEVQAQLDEVNKKLAQYENNIRIDDKIADLKAQRMDYEQKKADAENILKQIKTLSMRKNERLEAEVNSHFNIVKWRLFTEQQNGEIVDCCVPVIDGHDYDFAANGALKIIAKLDICNAFQKFYGISLPVFLDSAGEISEHNVPKFDFQLIQLRRTTDKELRIESV